MGQIVDLIRGSFPKDVNIEQYFTKSSSRSYGVSLFGAEDALVLRDGGWLKVGLFGGQFLLEFSNTYTLAVHVLGFTFNGIFSVDAGFRADAGKWGREAGLAVGSLPNTTAALDTACLARVERTRLFCLPLASQPSK